MHSISVTSSDNSNSSKNLTQHFTIMKTYTALVRSTDLQFFNLKLIIRDIGIMFFILLVVLGIVI